jgi:hypothetical protein
MRPRASGASPGDGAQHPYAVQPKQWNNRMGGRRRRAVDAQKGDRPNPMREATKVPTLGTLLSNVVCTVHMYTT